MSKHNNTHKSCQTMMQYYRNVNILDGKGPYNFTCSGCGSTFILEFQPDLFCPECGMMFNNVSSLVCFSVALRLLQYKRTEEALYNEIWTGHTRGY